MALLDLAGGRPRSNLLYVTSDAALSRLDSESSAAIDAVPKARRVVLSGKPTDVRKAAHEVRHALRENREIEGVVVIGGYDVVPSRRVLALNRRLRHRLKRHHVGLGVDPDQFIVWNDDLYGDRDGNDLPELPVSRIPDARTGGAVHGALQARGQHPGQPALGIWASQFGFAEEIYRTLVDPNSDGNKYISPPASSSSKQGDPPANYGAGDGTRVKPGGLAANRVYLVLHGNPNETTYKGSDYDPDYPGWQPVAVDGALFEGEWQAAPVVFAGVCWGALVVSTKALDYQPAHTPVPLSPEQSIALAFLAHGATAFIGFTALHYIPGGKPPYDHIYGLPLHRLFWHNYTQCHMAPAEALFRAKARYIRDIPYGRLDALSLAIGMKTYWSATCLGLGW